jgi:hypothetical protein
MFSPVPFVLFAFLNPAAEISFKGAHGLIEGVGIANNVWVNRQQSTAFRQPVSFRHVITAQA